MDQVKITVKMNSKYVHKPYWALERLHENNFKIVSGSESYNYLAKKGYKFIFDRTDMILYQNHNFLADHPQYNFYCGITAEAREVLKDCINLLKQEGSDTKHQVLEKLEELVNG